MNPAILLCGHGSRDQAGVSDFLQLAERLRLRFPHRVVAHSFLEFAEPDIPKALTLLRERGLGEMCAVPIMLTAAGHVQRDLPAIFEAFRVRHPEMHIRLAAELGLDRKIVAAAEARIRASLAARQCTPDEYCLLVVGRGASDFRAISSVRSVTGTLCAALSCARGETCFCGIAEPSLEGALQRRPDRKCVVVFPLLLFRGVLLERIRNAVAAARLAHPEVEFIEAECLGDHPLIVETIAERIEECERRA